MIKDVESLQDQVKSDIKKEESKRDELQAVVDAPEENPRGPLSKEAENLKSDNEKLRQTQDKQGVELISHRDDRN